MVDCLRGGDKDIALAVELELRYVLVEPEDMTVFSCQVPGFVQHEYAVVYADAVVAVLFLKLDGNCSRAAA